MSDCFSQSLSTNGRALRADLFEDPDRQMLNGLKWEMIKKALKVQKKKKWLRLEMLKGNGPEKCQITMDCKFGENYPSSEVEGGNHLHPVKRQTGKEFSP